MTDRQYTRKRILQSKEFKVALREVDKRLGGKFDYALIGGLAVAYYANPPVTVDVDFFVDAVEQEVEEIAETFVRDGWTQVPLRFTARMKGFPRRGVRVYRESPPADIDFLATGGDVYLQSVVRRAKYQEVAPGVVVKVIGPEDLIIVKTLAGRDKDIEDVIRVTKALGEKLNQEYIDRKIEELE